MAKSKATLLLEKENQELRDRMANLEKSMGVPTKAVETPKEEFSDYNEIPMNRSVKVMSLFCGKMNLQPNEKKNIPFERFGVIKPIIYADLVEICDRQRHFAEEGMFMILDDDVVKAQYLDEIYKGMLTAKQILGLIDKSKAEITEAYTKAPIGIKQAIVDTVTQGLLKNDPKYYDRNKIQIFSDLCGRDLFKDAEGLREWDKK